MNHGWKYITSDECFSSITPKCKIEKKNYSNGSLIPIISQEEDFISGYWDNYADITPHSSPVVVFGDHSRVLKYIDFDFVVGADGVKILLPHEPISAKFLYYFLKWTDIPSLGYSRHFRLLKEYKYPCPQTQDQNTVNSELDKINELIDVKRSQLADLDLLAQALFYETFGDPITNSKGWEISKVAEILETGSGGTPSKSVDEYWNSEEIPWIGSNMCQNKILYKTDGRFISRLGLENSSAKLLEPDTILIALVGATIGKVALIKIPTSTNQNIGYIKPHKNIINPIFLFYTIQGLYSLFLEIGNGKFKMANLSFIRNLPIILPPISLQNEFAIKIEAIEEQKKCIDSSLADLQTLLASRMDYWFND